jgi:hypothetical protein
VAVCEIGLIRAWYTYYIIDNNNGIDKETNEFIEASFEKWSGILVGEFQRVRENMTEMEDRLNHRMDGIKANLDSKIDTVKRIVDRVDERTARQVDAVHTDVITI